MRKKRCAIVGLLWAWVLWEQFSFFGGPAVSGSTGWSARDAAETRQECDEKRSKALLKLWRPSTEAMVVGISESTVTWLVIKPEPGKVGMLSWKFECFPDTVDPRPRSDR